MLIWLTTLGWAEDTDSTSEGTIVVEESLPQTSSSTTIEVDDTVSDTASLAEVLQRQSSVVIRDMGGVGTTATISIRGTSTRQSLMLLNGVPLNPDGNGTVNLQDIPVHMLEHDVVSVTQSPASDVVDDWRYWTCKRDRGFRISARRDGFVDQHLVAWEYPLFTGSKSWKHLCVWLFCQECLPLF